MKDVAIPQTLIQVDRDILRHCRMCSIGEIFLNQSVCTKAAQSRFWGSFLTFGQLRIQLFCAFVLTHISLTFFTQIFALCVICELAEAVTDEKHLFCLKPKKYLVASLPSQGD